MMPVMPTDTQHDVTGFSNFFPQVCSASSGHSVDPVRLRQVADLGKPASHTAGRGAQGADLHPDDQDA